MRVPTVTLLKQARILLPQILFLLVFSFAAFGGQYSPGASRYPIRGTAVNSITGEPIRGALVRIFSDRQRSVLSGADGTFQFADVPAGTVNLSVEKPGFFPQQAIQSPRSQASFAVSGPDQPLLLLKLIPEAVISGHVSGDGGEPVEGFPVQLLAERVENGKRTRVNLRSASTNDEGEFRAAELPPGKYFIFAGPSSSPVNLIPGLQAGARGYAGTFYPSAPDITAASQVEVASGQRVEINFDLQSQPFHRISGTVSGYPQDAGISLQVKNAAGQQMPAGFRFDPRDGTFRTMWLPPGQYTLTAEMRDADGQKGYYATQNVNLSSDIVGVHLHLLPGLNIPVNARVERTHSDSSGPETQTMTFSTGRGKTVQRQVFMFANVLLTKQNGSFEQQQIGAQFGPAEDSPYELSNVPPGVYSVQINPTGPWYVESARSGSLNLLEQNLIVAAGSAVEPIEIVLRDDFARLEGSVLLAANSDSATVLAIPEGGRGQTPRVDVSRPEPVLDVSRSIPASFMLPPLAPGTYKVLAVDRANDFEYDNPEVLQKYLSKAREVSLVPNQQGKIELEVVHVGE